MASTIAAASTATIPARNTATVCQSHARLLCRRTWAKTPMRVNEKLPQSIQRYGRASEWTMWER